MLIVRPTTPMCLYCGHFNTFGVNLRVVYLIFCRDCRKGAAGRNGASPWRN